MKNNNAVCILFIIVVQMFCTAASGHASPNVTAVASASNGQFDVQVSGLSAFAGFEIDIKYDKSSLKNPVITQGSLVSGMPTVIANEAGLVVYTGVDQNPKTRTGGTGTIATVSFDMGGNTSANVSGTAMFKDVNGAVLLTRPFSVTITRSFNSAGTNWTNAGSGTDGTTGTTEVAPSAATGSANAVVLGGVSMPDSGMAATAKNKEETSLPAVEPEKTQKHIPDVVQKDISPPTAVAALQTPPQATNAVVNKSVLELFQEFRGEKNPNNLVALLHGAMAGSMQDPPLALSDGKTSVKLHIKLPAAGSSSVNFAAIDAKLISMNKQADSSWIVEVLPNQGSFDAAVIILQDGATVKIPLIVAPHLSAETRIGKDGKLTLADFSTFLGDRGSEKAPRYDLNGDGKRDYIDDFIFTANFLVKSDAAKTAAEKKVQGAQ